MLPCFWLRATAKRETPAGERDSVAGQDLSRLGYPDPQVTAEAGHAHYRQQGYGGFRYEICVRWKTTAARTIEGCWSIGTDGSARVSPLDTEQQVSRAWKRGFDADWTVHDRWWDRFWRQSSISVPDPILERQWYREIYKFGSASRRGAPPITLQAVWTADNGSSASLERGLSQRPQYPAFLLALLQQQPPGRGARLSRLAVGHPRGVQAVHPEFLRFRRTECGRGGHPHRSADGRLGPVLAFPDRFGLAGAPFLPSLAIQPGPEISGGEGLSLDPGCRGLSGLGILRDRGRIPAPAAEFEPGDP